MKTVFTFYLIANRWQLKHSHVSLLSHSSDSESRLPSLSQPQQLVIRSFSISTSKTPSSTKSPPSSFYITMDKKASMGHLCSSSSSSRKNTTKRRGSFIRKCASLVKEQRARFYIIRRCVTMLVCWQD